MEVVYLLIILIIAVATPRIVEGYGQLPVSDRTGIYKKVYMYRSDPFYRPEYVYSMGQPYRSGDRYVRTIKPTKQSTFEFEGGDWYSFPVSYYKYFDFHPNHSRYDNDF